MPISAISAASRSRPPGSVSCCPRWRINYFGQGALVLAHPEAIANPFFCSYPDWALLPMVILATAATVIASQAVITGAYSLTCQAIQLGLLPRLRNPAHLGGSIPARSTCRASTRCCSSACCCWSLMFRSSSALASAYGIAVTGHDGGRRHDGFVVIWQLWKWHWWQRRAADCAVPLHRR